MCGIVGYIGKKKALPILIQGLKKLEYRGYDSAGVAYLNPDKSVSICKSVGRIAALEEKINMNEESTIGIGHTRWATHGGVTEINSHPHHVGNVTIVHNGIIENYLELKEELIKEGYTFVSDTDTEVACCYIDFLYQKNQTEKVNTILFECTKKFIGSYAIVVMIDGIDDKLFVMKKDSPLIIGIGEEENYIASDISAYGDVTSSYIPLEDFEIGVIRKDEVKIFRNGKQCVLEIKDIDNKFQNTGKDGFEHYMLKEIYEQKILITEWNQEYFDNGKLETLPLIYKYKKIHIVGCGTAYHAGLIGKYLLEKYLDMEIQVFIASEYRYQKLFIDEDTLVIAISQSGETADTLACLKRAKELGAHTLGIVNVYDSSIARFVDDVIYTKAGSEIAVASTKAYTAQVYMLTMLLLRNGSMMNKVKIEDMKNDYQSLPFMIETLIHQQYSSVIESLEHEDSIFYLGRNIDYVSMMEGALKLKEISYIHSEAMAAGELKHGTISLMGDDTKVVVLATEENLASKTISNMKEVKARGAKIILLASEGIRNSLDRTCYDVVIWLPKGIDLIQPIVNVVPLQMIAYYVAKSRGCDIDKPKNLAKSVTVE